MQTLWLMFLLVGLACTVLFYRAQSRMQLFKISALRRHRAEMSYRYGLYFLLLTLAALYLGTDGLGGDVFLAGFGLMFVALLVWRIPREHEVEAFEAGERAGTQRGETGHKAAAEAPQTARRRYQPPQPDTAEEAPRIDRQRQQRQAEPPPPPKESAAAMGNPHRRGSRLWAQHELAVTDSAAASDINAAYRRLMRMAHPDHGGANDFAADLNLARKVLLG